MTPHQVIMIRAAQLLEEHAVDLKASPTRSDGTWDIDDPLDARAEADYQEHLALAAKLKFMATL